MSTTPAAIAYSKEMNIFQRINEVRKRVAYIKKEKEIQGYMAVTHDDVTAALRPSLIEYGVIVKPSLVSGATVQDTLMSTKNKIPIIRYEAEFDVFFINADNPTDRESMRVPAHALDQGDKAPGKALSYATKAAELKMFTVETGLSDEERMDDDIQGGMPLKVFADWEAAIDALTSKEEGEALWKRIIADCNKFDDAIAVTKLKGRLSAKATAMKRLASKKPAAAKEGVKDVVTS